jgi:hypothetical protein
VIRDFGQADPSSARRRVRIDAFLQLADTARAIRDTLHDLQSDDRPLVLHMLGHGSRSSAPDLMKSDGSVVVEYRSYWRQTALADAQIAWVLNQCLSGAPVSLAPTDAEHSARWQVLPRYASRPFAPRSCCGMSVLTRKELVAAQRRKEIAESASIRPEVLRTFLSMQLWVPPPPLVVIIRDKQLAQDYWASLRCLVNVVLDLVVRMVAVLLSALSRLAQAPSFLLVMLAVARHYGRRGESDDDFALTPRAQPMRPRGAACLAM